MTLTLQDKVALVTGGSRGIGRAISLSLAEAGATVFVNYASNAGAAQETLGLCKQEQSQAMGFDVSNREEVDRAIEKIRERAGKLDILVNNAGITSDALMIRLKDEDWKRTLAINLDGAFFCSRAAARVMMKARTGRIINISSVVGEMGNAGQVAYVSSKAGLIGLTKALARELSARAITVNAVTPGFIDTDMTKKLDDEVRTLHLKNVPLGRMGEAREVAALVSFLASDPAGYITGQVIGVNGGLYM
jgi:3-oxoacyl-[acyl-carrier protein] reductase